MKEHNMKLSLVILVRVLTVTATLMNRAVGSNLAAKLNFQHHLSFFSENFGRSKNSVICADSAQAENYIWSTSLLEFGKFGTRAICSSKLFPFRSFCFCSCCCW
jgi:hypothetical protein